MLMLMRVLHIGFGVFWVGTLFFTAFFLFPAMRDAGPDGAKVGAQLMKRNFTNIMPATAILTILAGIWLFYRISGGFNTEYMGTSAGKAYSIGGATAIIALVIGLIWVRPSMIKAMKLGQAAAGGAPADQQRMQAEAGALRARAGKANLLIAVLLLITVVTMAIGRYL
jgi:uncharacterized membrane protein